MYETVVRRGMDIEIGEVVAEGLAELDKALFINHAHDGRILIGTKSEDVYLLTKKGWEREKKIETKETTKGDNEEKKQDENQD